jgi:N-acetylglucosaminyl-diphospho-decaprenol L-rhamnosyltransferase
MLSPSFTFILVTFCNADTIVPCLESIILHTRGSYEIVVVDNSPDERTVSAVQQFASLHPAVNLRSVRSDDNIGFSRACNAGARLASGEFLFFLNPDTRLQNDAAGLLAACFDSHPTTVAAGPAILDAVGHITHTCRNLPNLGRILLDAIGLDRWCGFYKLTRFAHNVPRKVEQIIGAAMLVRRPEYQKIGGMDERFFMYFEEVDFCKRLRETGKDIWFWPAARVQHAAGSSCEADAVRARMIFVLRESRKKYFQKHFGTLRAAALGLINRLEGLAKSATLTLLWTLRRKRSYREKARGFWAVATGIAPQFRQER